MTRKLNLSFEVAAGISERELRRRNSPSGSKKFPPRKANSLFGLTPGQIADAFTVKEADEYHAIIQRHLLSGERISNADLAEIEEFISDHQSRGLEEVSKLARVVTQIMNGE